MANVKISQLPSLSTLSGPDEFPVVHSGTTYNITANAITAFATMSVPAANVTGFDTQVNAYLNSGNFTGNFIPNGNATQSLGNATNQWLDLWVSNATIYLNSVPLSVAGNGVLQFNGNDIVTSGDNVVNTGNVETTGNIAGAFIIGDGSQLTNVAASTGDVTFDNTTVQGLGGLQLSAGPDFTANLAYLRVRSGDQPSHIHLDTGDNTIYDLLVGDDGKYVQVGLGGNISIASYGNSGQYIWNFDTDGNLILPGNTFAVNYANGTPVNIGGGGSANTGNVTFSDQVVIGTGTTDGGGGLYLAPGPASIAENVQYLRVRGGDFATHIHFDTGNNLYFDQYFGADDKYVKLEATGNVVINANDLAGNSATWNFSTTGVATLPGEGILQSIDDSITLTSLNTVSGNANSVYLGSSGGLGFNDQEIGGNWLEIFRNGTEPQITVPVGRGNLTIQTALGNTAYNWVLDDTGNLTLPGNTFAVNYANGTPVNIGGGASTGDITFVNTTISAPNEDDIRIQAVDNNGRPSSTVLLSPNDLLTRVQQWSGQNSATFTTANWATGTYTEISGQGAVVFTGATDIINFVSSLVGVGQIYFSVNGGPQLAWDGSSAGPTDITFYTPTLPAVDPTTVTSFEYFYSYNSLIEIDYDAEEFNIESNNADLTLQTQGQGGIQIFSAENLSLQGNGGISISNQSNVLGIDIRTDSTSLSAPAWLYGVDGSLALATINDESAKFIGTRRIINGALTGATSPYSVTLAAGGNATVAYTSTTGVQSTKVTFAIQSNGAGFQWEQFDVVATPNSDTPGAVNFVVSNRVKAAAAIPDTAVTATMTGSQIEISLTLDAGQTSGWASFDAVEFGLMVD